MAQNIACNLLTQLSSETSLQLQDETTTLDCAHSRINRSRPVWLCFQSDETNTDYWYSVWNGLTNEDITRSEGFQIAFLRAASTINVVNPSSFLFYVLDRLLKSTLIDILLMKDHAFLVMVNQSRIGFEATVCWRYDQVTSVGRDFVSSCCCDFNHACAHKASSKEYIKLFGFLEKWYHGNLSSVLIAFFLRSKASYQINFMRFWFDIDQISYNRSFKSFNFLFMS